MYDVAREATMQQKRRLMSLLIFVCAAAAIVGGRFFYWHALCGFRDALIEDHRWSEIPQVGRRGDILDAGGHYLVMDVSHYNIATDPSQFHNDTEREALATRILPAMDLTTKAQVAAKLKDNAKLGYLLLEQNVPDSKVSLIPENTLVFLEPVPNRAYPEGSLASQTLGLVGMDRYGLSGVEAYYNDVLTGTNGLERIYDGPWGQYRHEIRPAADGADLVLTIDRVIQYETEKILEQTVLQQRADSGTIIVMEPKTGAILAMANYPTFDPNRYAEFWSVPGDLIENPAISDQYEPGSVFKIVTMAAGLDSGTVRPDSVYEDTGSVWVGGQVIYNHDRAAYGTTTMTELLVHSLNVGAAKIALQMRAPTFYKYVESFGFGKKTGVDLAGEISGTFNEPGDPEWSESDLATNSFGQGIAVTPLQMVSAIAAVANGGTMVKPHIVREIRRGEKVERPSFPVGPRIISEQTAHDLTHMMVDATAIGCPAAMVDGYKVAGKTGTAQMPIPGGYSENPEDIIASFAGYVPADEPKFVILVVIERPRINSWGTTVAAPVFSSLAERILSLMDVPSDAVRAASR